MVSKLLFDCRKICIKAVVDNIFKRMDMSGHFLITGQMGLQLKSININYPVENQNKVKSIQSDFIKILMYFQQLNLLFFIKTFILSS